MPSDLISLDEASWRLETSEISGRIFAELLCKSEALLLGLPPGQGVRDPVDLSQVTRFEAEPENVVVAGNVRWKDVKLSWRELSAAFEKRGCKISWTWHSDITPELLELSRQPDPARRLLGDPRPPPSLMLPSESVAPPQRRASPEWFADTVYTSFVPASGKAPPARRGPRSAKREKAAAAIRSDLAGGTLTLAALRAMREKQLADRYAVSRDTARKARNDALESFVENSPSTFDK